MFGQADAVVHTASPGDEDIRTVEDDSAHGYYIIGNGANSTVAELTEAAAYTDPAGHGQCARVGPGVVPVLPQVA